MTAKEGNKRVTGKEQYYTPNNLAISLVSTLVKTIVDKSGTFFLEGEASLWIEPAGGTGNFVRAAYNYGYSVWSCDIEPKYKGIEKKDFLTVDLAGLEKTNVVVFGNPPFGRNNSLSVKFFNHSAEVADYIAFIVPRSWRKWSVINKLDDRFECVYDLDLSHNYVDDEGVEFKGGSLKTCFQIWKRSTSLRKPVEVEDRGYITKCGPDEADISMTVFGHGCGKVKREFERVPNSTQMFLKADDYVIKAMEKIDFSEFYNRTAYIEALSIKEIRYCLNRYFDQ
jgi:hypothetical protein